ncbi:S-layer family protein [Methylosinus sp. RM1]|uniref:beta strand repeat-containing protein n=1 Tax=Methylosinus sp. RM1 TaxID=2583817 RepID=UPI001FEF079F|nr:GLUG motif-containing protein [Methylosinus sp. RM1]
MSQSSRMTMTAIAAILALPSFALANPTGGVVVDGAATISSTPNVTNVTQSTNRAIINWQGFSIGVGETVNFLQPTAMSVTLNRVVGNEQSIIAGALNANGKVFIINSNGIMFTKDAQVNVGGLVASTLDISNSNFMAGNYTFSGSSSAAVVNKGTINAADGGYVALLGKAVSNEGTINAKLGTIALASGDAITLNFSGDSLLDVTIDKGTYDALVENKGLIKADGGNVVMTAKAADAVLSAQVNNSGIIQARTLADLTGGSSSTGSVKIGKIKLLAQGGRTKVSGTLDASAPDCGKGGTIETSGDKVTIADGTLVTTAAAFGETGTWTIDPDGFTIGTNGDITGTLLGSLLASNNITLWSTSGGGTDGNLNVNSAVSWSGNTILTLNATNNININSSITATGANAGLVLNYGNYASTGSAASGTNYSINTANGASVTLSGASASLKINGDAYRLIHSMSDLAAIDGGSGYYALAQNLDASGTTYASAVVPTLAGTLAGLGHTVSNLTINASAGIENIGLIGSLGSRTSSAGAVRDIGLVGASITGSTASFKLGSLVAENGGKITNAYASNLTINGLHTVGGLVAVNWSTGVIDNSYVTGTLTTPVTTIPANEIGGLVGWDLGVVTNSHTNVAINILGRASNVGGLVGQSYGGKISDSYATGDLNANDTSAIGGLIGQATNNGSNINTITNSYATGNVTVNWTNATETNGGGVGGLVGGERGGAITNSWASGNVTIHAPNSTYGVNNVGGLVGGLSGVTNLGLVDGKWVVVSTTPGTITGSHASGNVSAGVNSVNVGGLVGTASLSSISNSSASGNVTGLTQVGGLVGSNSGSISDVSATGNVTATSPRGEVGGLVGRNSGAIDRAFASGDVSGGRYAGALVGVNVDTVQNTGTLIGSVTNSSAIGSVSGGANAGGLIGNNTGKLGAITNNSYRDVKAEARAAAQLAATQRTAAAAGNVISNAAEVAATKPQNAAASTAAGKSAVASANASANIDDNLTGQESTQTQLPAARAPARIASSANAGGARRAQAPLPGAHYRARIRSIEIDGQHFDLGTDGKNSAPAPKAQ